MKIGSTTGPLKTRVSELQVGNAAKLIVEMEFKTPRFTYYENSLHKYFQGNHIRGEWFKIPLGVDYAKVIDHSKIGIWLFYGLCLLGRHTW